jgi:hypothetical protein
MRCLRVALAVGLLTIGFDGCGSGRGSATSASFATSGPDGLRPVSGYRSYEDCGRVTSACAGRVPAALRRPLRLTKLASGQRCPVTRQHVARGDFPGALGREPIYADVSGHNGLVRFAYPPPRAGSGRQFAGSNWSGFKVLWVSRPSYNGPVLIRGRQLDGSHAVGFGQDAVPFAELQLPPGSAAGAPRSQNGWRDWPSTTRIRSPGCYGWQIDGSHSSELIVIRATP